MDARPMPVNAGGASSVALLLMPVMAAVLVVFVITGAALPALPLHIHDDLGFGASVVGLVAGAAFSSPLFSPRLAGSSPPRRWRQTRAISAAGTSLPGGPF